MMHTMIWNLNFDRDAYVDVDSLQLPPPDARAPNFEYLPYISS